MLLVLILTQNVWTGTHINKINYLKREYIQDYLRCILAVDELVGTAQLCPGLVYNKRCRIRKVHLELVLHGALFFNIFRIDILKFQKIPKKILDVDIYVLHSPANFQSEIVCTLTYTKMTNSVRSENFKSDTVHRLRSRYLLFLHSSK